MTKGFSPTINLYILKYILNLHKGDLHRVRVLIEVSKKNINNKKENIYLV